MSTVVHLRPLLVQSYCDFQGIQRGRTKSQKSFGGCLLSDRRIARAHDPHNWRLLTLKQVVYLFEVYSA